MILNQKNIKLKTRRIKRTKEGGGRGEKQRKRVLKLCCEEREEGRERGGEGILVVVGGGGVCFSDDVDVLEDIYVFFLFVYLVFGFIFSFEKN